MARVRIEVESGLGRSRVPVCMATIGRALRLVGKSNRGADIRCGVPTNPPVRSADWQEALGAETTESFL